LLRGVRSKASGVPRQSYVCWIVWNQCNVCVGLSGINIMFCVGLSGINVMFVLNCLESILCLCWVVWNQCYVCVDLSGATLNVSMFVLNGLDLMFVCLC
jgi:hypothetical protein